jgi:hypothetical protein
MTPARFRWGILLIQVGVLILLRNFGALGDSFWEDLLIWSPVLLIAIGVEKIFTKSKLQFISYLTSVFLFFGGLAIAFGSTWDGIDGGFFSEVTYTRDYDPQVKKLHARLRLKETNLTIRDSGSDLVYGKFDKFTRKPRIEYGLEGNEATISLTGKRHSYLGGVVKVNMDDSQDWYLRFSRDVPLDMECSGDGSDIHLNLSTTPLAHLKLVADEARIYLKLGDLEPQAHVTIRGEDSNVRLRIPVNVGLRVLGKDYGAYLEEVGLISSGDFYISDSFDSSQTKVDVELDERFGSFSLDFF